jgi:hypothetical protein
MKPQGGFLALPALPALIALFACVLPVAAELRPVGSPIEIAPPETSFDDELQARVAVARNGDVLVVWSRSVNGSSEVFGRLFRRDGTPTTPAPFVLNADTAENQWQPQVATHGDGFAVLWANSDGFPGPPGSPPPTYFRYRALSLRLLDRDGAFRGPEIEVGGGKLGASFPFLLTYPSGEIVVLWTDGAPPYAQHGQRFDGALQALTGPFRVAPPVVFGAVELPSGGFAVLSWGPRSDLFVGLFGPTGTPIGEAQVTSKTQPQRWGAIGSFGAEGYGVAWSDDSGDVFLRRFDSTGTPVGQEALVADESPVPYPTALYPTALAADEAGNAVVVWHFDDVVTASFIDRQGEPARPPLQLSPAEPPRDRLHLATNRRDWAITSLEQAGTGNLNRRVVLQRLTAGCVPDATTLCLGGGRFEAKVVWQTPPAAGPGFAVPLTGDTGGFWFFGAGNLELVTKVVDGTAVNGEYWVFAAGLSSVQYELSVRDLLSGRTRTYVHPAGPLESRADTRAFPSDGAAPPPPAAGAVGAGKAHPAMPCSATPESLCLQQTRFRVQVRFVDPGTGETRLARARGFSDAAGFFSFFDPDNVEVFVKILDGTPVNGRFWVFHAALSDVEYTIDVLDVFDGHLSWSYHNPRGRLHSAADTDAF